MNEEKKEPGKKKLSAKDFGKMLIREAVNLMIGMTLGEFKAMQINDFLFRE